MIRAPSFQTGESLPVRTVWEGVMPYLGQATPPTSSSYDRSVRSLSAGRIFTYSAPAVPFCPSVKRERYDAGLIVEEVEYQTGPLTRATASIVKPRRATTTSLPGLLLFHCHSGVYRWGREKVLATPEDSKELKSFRQAKYDGRSIAQDFADKGFVVMVPDAFYFGPRALGREGIDSPSSEIDRFRKNSEPLVAKMLLLAGHSWPALTAWEDRKALDYFCTRPEVDRHRIGCLGLSFGGFRSILLAAQDRRIHCLVTAGWLTTLEDLFLEKLKNHSWMVLPGGIFPELDFSTVVANAFPAAFMALLCNRDHLFTLKGMRVASESVASFYRQFGRKELCCIKFFDSDHRMTREMQDQAIHWVERFLCQEKFI